MTRLVRRAARQCRGGARCGRAPGVLQRQRGLLEDPLGGCAPHAQQYGNRAKQEDNKKKRIAGQRPLLSAIMQRGTHRVSRGSSVEGGSMSYTSSSPRAPLSELEEAMLIAMTGCTGLDDADRPLRDPRDHSPIMAKPNWNMAGRTAGSPDNAQGTSFFSSMTSVTYFLRTLPPPEDGHGGTWVHLQPAAGPGARGEGPTDGPPHRCSRRKPRFPSLSGLRSIPLQPAGHHHPVPGGRPVTAVHQRTDGSV